MSHQFFLKFRAFAVVAVIPLLGLFMASAHADSVDVTVAPPAGAASASVSSPPPKRFLAGYTVTIANNTAGQINRPFVLWGRAVTVQADDSLGPYAVFAQSPESPAFCANLPIPETVPGFGEYFVRCELPNVPAGTTQFTLNFVTPASGKSLKFTWVNTRPITSFNPADVDTGTTSVALITQPLADINKSLSTVVPSSGLTIWTGSVVSLDPSAPPGSAATRTDPFTTTVVIPPFTFASFTTASILEEVDPNSCSPSYGQCFLTDLNIPGGFAYLEIYLRIDASRITPAGNINTAQLEYSPNGAPPYAPIPNCNPLAFPAEPNATIKRCIAARKKYPLSGTSPALPGLEWKGDWEFRIKALENGKIRFN